ncbi:MAG: UDP-N-acetylmuramoyl-L-alanine--D-glutamate ligase [Bacteroidetes bacterium]|nr:MAG: UDP-N-acetylmuramoyl-L-alanine--D-glutamate ligase [Bacteroidota bacterium]
MNKKIVILGAGESGVGSAILAKKQGYDVFVSDNGNILPHYEEELKQHQIEYEKEQHTERKILNADEVVISPGIPLNVPIVQKLKQKNIPVLSELDFAQRFTKAKIIAVTGTNGKSTTASWIYHTFKLAGYNVCLAGNIGNSFAKEIALNNHYDWLVLEVSSFQLDSSYSFHPHIAIITNITRNHLNRYNNSMQEYINAKFRIIQNQTPQDYLAYNTDDKNITTEIEKRNILSKQLPLSINKTLNTDGAWIENNQIIIQINQQKSTIMDVLELALKGRHNIYNALATAIPSKIAEIKNEVIRESFKTFENLEHRMEYVNTVNGAIYINDSKATTVQAAYYALSTQTKPVIWICGGQDKGNEYSELYEVVKQKVKAIICLGKDNTKIINAFKNIVPVIVDTHSMEDAVKSAYRLAKKDDVVLLSPACASFDLFKSYEERGEKFKTLVKQL